MSKKVSDHKAWFDGISDFSKSGSEASYQSGRSIDHRSDTRSITLLPRTLKESGTVVTGLPKWAVTPPTTCGDTFIYDETGTITSRSSVGSYTSLRTVPTSHGNGMAYFGEDNFIYYTGDKTVGRYGPICTANPQFNDDFFGSQGGNRTNTNSLELLKASSQYATRASTSSLQVAGDLSLEAQIHPYTVPTGSETQTLISKWDETGATRSYKFDIATTSNFFGDGSDGALTISVDTTDAPIDSACSGTSGSATLTATNVSFAAGQIVYIHQTRGTGAGTWQKNKIQSYTAGTITLVEALNATYTSSGSSCAQVLVLKQYSSVTVNSGKTWTAKAWNGTVGGILGFLCSGTFTNSGTITASGKGFRGGARAPQGSWSYTGEGTAGASYQETGTPRNGPANGNGGGASKAVSWTGPSQFGYGGGGGGANASTGTVGDFYGSQGWGGSGGTSAGSADLTTIVFGGGGGGGSSDGDVYPSQLFGGPGGAGGGIILPWALSITNTGSIVSDGAVGTGNNSQPIMPNCYQGGGGGGAGGSIHYKTQTGALGTLLTSSVSGRGGYSSWSGGAPVTTGYGSGRGGAGSDGRVHIDYLTSYTGTSTPTIDATQDNNLGNSDGNILRLALSSTGSNSEIYSKPVTLTLDQWQHVAVTWNSLTSTAEFFLNGVTLGTQTGALTAIHQNLGAFYVGAHKGASVVEGFYDGLIDEVRVWSVTKTNVDFLVYMTDQILSTYTGERAYYQFNNTAVDQTANANTLTLTNGPIYSTDTPFIGASTRLDIDQSATTAGNTYTVPLTITESSTTIKTFTPEKDPQKSFAVLIAAKGTGDWTLIIHDQYNNEVASKTLTNANLAVGYTEFIFSTPWRPQLNQNYHMHLTSTVADGTVTTTNAGELSTVSFKTYFQFLVTDTDFHPVANFLQFLVFGNERYVGTLEATLYEPNALTLPSGFRVRCFGYWNEYLAIGTWKGSSVSDFDSGRIFFWDGVSDTYNFFIDVPEGAINSMIGTRGSLYFMAGYRAKLMVYEGGAKARKLKNLLNTENNTTVEVYPGAMTMWRALMRIGVAGNQNDATIYRGAYTWGAVNEQYNDSLSFDYPISTGNYQGNNVRIGLTHVVSNKLLIGWQDGTACGVDYVDISNPPYPSGEVWMLIGDDGAMYHDKEMVTLASQFAPLASGESVSCMYKLDRNSSAITPVTQSTAGERTARAVIATNGSRYMEQQVGVKLETSTTTSPVVYAVNAEIDSLTEEKIVGGKP